MKFVIDRIDLTRAGEVNHWEISPGGEKVTIDWTPDCIRLGGQPIFTKEAQAVIAKECGSVMVDELHEYVVDTVARRVFIKTIRTE